MKFLRSTLFVTATAIVAAACGDKVTVAGPTTTAPKVNSVSVAPATATLTVGDKITLSAAVNADAGVATTVTWAASAANVSVDAGGVVTAVSATPGVAVCATSTVDTGKKGCASIVVTATAPAIPASVSIASITVAGNLNAPVNPAAVAGQIDITLNVNPGNQTISKVVQMVGSVRADSQLFTAAQAAALRSAADLSLAQQTTFPQVLFSINTAAFNATTGVPTWQNGAQAVSALVYTKQGGTASAATASAATSLTFANANTWILTSTVSGASAANGTGYTFRTGNIAATVLPVIYNGLSMSSTTAANLTFGGACDATGARTLALSTTAPYTVTFTKATGAASATDFKSYEYRAAVCPTFTPEGFTLTAVDNNGNQLYSAAQGNNVAANTAANVYRMDNVAPAAPAVFINPNLRQNGWLNDVAQLTTVQAATNLEGMVTAAIADAGVGSVTYAAKASTTLALAIAAADITTASSLAASLGNTTYCLVQYSQDKLANRSADPAACATTFGVDRAAPTIAFSGGLASNARGSAATVAAEFQVTVLDTGTVGNSGMNSTRSVMGTVLLRNATATAAATCIVGTYPVGGPCTEASVNVAPVFPLVPTTVVAANALPGYFTYTGVALDAAGNRSAAVTRVIVHDDAATPPAVTFATPFLPGSLNAAATAVSVVTSDNLDIRDFQWTFTYGATMGAFPIQTAQTAVNAFNATPLINTSYTINFSGSLMRQIQENGALWTPGAAVVLSAINTNVRDQGGSVGTTIVTPVPAGTVNFTTAATNYAAVAGTPSNWIISNAATNVSDGAPVAPAVAANPTSVTLNADADGATAVFNSPFSRVDFYALNTAGTQWVLIGSIASPTTTDNGVLRRHRYSLSWTPGTAFGLGAKSIRAVGVNAANDGFSTITNGLITITNP